MNLYLITQDLVDGYYTFDAAVVAAESEDDARNIHPSPFVTHVSNGKWMGTYAREPNEEYEAGNDGWVSHENIHCIKVEYLGPTTKARGVVLASFNGGQR